MEEVKVDEKKRGDMDLGYGGGGVDGWGRDYKIRNHLLYFMASRI